MHLNYKRLQSNESTRALLPLNGGKQGEQELASFALESILLESVQNGERSYAALSYCWEIDMYSADPNSNDRIQFVQCDGTTIVVTSNLFDALSALSVEPSFAALWVDAICIN